jgi:hypothetical protein
MITLEKWLWDHAKRLRDKLRGNPIAVVSPA